jgi:alpha-amylase
MNRLRGWLWLVIVVVTLPRTAFAQSGFDDDRVMLQGFYWESYRHGDPQFPQYGTKRWYDMVKDNAGTIREGRFDLVWLPPPCWAGARSAGYNPKQLWKFANSYGSFEQHGAMLKELLQKGVEPIADIVLNHRDGETSWADFQNPAWGLDAICRSDEVFSNKDSPFKDTPLDKRGADEERPSEYTQHGGTCYAYPSFRDIDHTNPEVRRDIIRYLLSLKSFGYRGWRYDMVHGYHAKRLALYNKRTQPTFSVGEYDWSAHGEMRGWIYTTSTAPDKDSVKQLTTSSNVFDFTTMFTLKGNKGNYKALYGYGNGTGMMGDTTENLPWKQRAVTFLENHDTGYRTNEDGTPQQDHKFDSFANNWEVEQGYAYILTHPGVPCVYWKHYFDWGNDLREKIKALVNARKVAGVKSGSKLWPQNNAGYKGVYAARVAGSNGDLFVRVGGSDDDWQPSESGYKDYREYARGAGWKVWVGLPGNPDFRQADRHAPFDMPEFRPAADINVPDDWLN